MTKTLDLPHVSSAERILDTALDLFAVKGYDATSVREICEAAGITKPTLYHFYGSKDGVLQALVRAGFDQYRAMVAKAFGESGSFRKQAKSLARSVFESARTQPRFWRFMVVVLAVSMWRLLPAPALTLPVAVSRKRFFTLDFVFILDIWPSSGQSAHPHAWPKGQDRTMRRGRWSRPGMSMGPRRGEGGV